MAHATLQRLGEGLEKQMRGLYETLSEKDQRRFAAFQARQLGYGGIGYVAEILGCSTRTISRGMAELDRLPDDPAIGRVRRPGAGRKKRLSPARMSRGTFSR